MAASARFWNRIANKYAASPIADEAAYQHKLEKTRTYFTPDSHVLELGCGTGSTALLHAPHVKEIRATDISPAMIDIARAKAAEAGIENVHFEVSSLEDLDCEGESQDVVLTLSLLHLLEDRHAALEEIRHWLKPGGVFVSSTACVGDKLWFMWPFLKVARLFGAVPMVKFFGRTRLVRDIEAAGFQIEYDWRPDKAVAVFIIARRP